MRELDYKIAALIGDKLRTRGKWRGYWSSANGKIHYSHMDDGPQHFSSDIAAAWRVVEFMRKSHGFDGYNGFLLTGIDGAWYCEFPNPTWTEFSGQTAPLAICKAALRACGVEV